MRKVLLSMKLELDEAHEGEISSKIAIIHLDKEQRTGNNLT